MTEIVDVNRTAALCAGADVGAGHGILVCRSNTIGSRRDYDG